MNPEFTLFGLSQARTATKIAVSPMPNEQPKAILSDLLSDSPPLFPFGGDVSSVGLSRMLLEADEIIVIDFTDEAVCDSDDAAGRDKVGKDPDTNIALSPNENAACCCSSHL